MNTLNHPVRQLRHYAIDRRQTGTYTNHNGRIFPMDFWTEICELDATRRSNALRVASGKRTGQLRARLLPLATMPRNND